MESNILTIRVYGVINVTFKMFGMNVEGQEEIIYSNKTFENLLKELKPKFPKESFSKVEIICSPKTDMHVYVGHQPIFMLPLTVNEKDMLYEALVNHKW